MKRIFFCSLILLFISCSGTNDSSPSAIAEIVAESFYQGDEATLTKHTTTKGFVTYSNFQKMFVKPKSSETDFKLIDENTASNVAWIKYSTAYDKTPGVFKLVRLDAEWKVTVRDPREKVSF
ncbi:hypothetical protein [Gelidibacter salicanalis]|uniref:DUF4878 domain-containing protein n=1 Tax=Gelidibacter salicanalis TaxID=291193 RepID=A0A934KUY2_9FLAO|nr:hypothetical protein [Gelidibacter salicanalis]MBJ7880703.1 hypothetical protein [Gelidibacter salicanalis]